MVTQVPSKKHTSVPFFPMTLPLPDLEIDTAPFWEGCKQHRLLVQRCKRCGEYRHPPSPVCHQCHSFEHEYVESVGTGEVFTFTIVRHPVMPQLNDVVPYNVVVVRLLDCGGAKIISNVVGVPNDAIAIGMRVEVIWDNVCPDFALPRFQPVAISASGQPKREEDSENQEEMR